MIAVDTNVLVAAHRRDAASHERAATALRELAEGTSQWAIPWPCVHEFLSVVTHPAIFDPPSTMPQALEQVDAWFESPQLMMLAEGAGYADRLRTVLLESGVVGPRVHDARIAVLCLYHRVSELWTADRDFSRFPDLGVRNPLI